MAIDIVGMGGRSEMMFQGVHHLAVPGGGAGSPRDSDLAS